MANPLDSAVVRLIPEAATLPRGRSIQFEARAVLPDGSEVVPEVVWSSAGGTITPAGLFLANLEPGTYLVTAQIEGRQRAGSTSVKVDPASLDNLLLNPSSVSLATREARQFTVAASWSDGSTAEPGLVWSATGGTVSSSGLYTAGEVAGTYRVIAAAADRADTSAVTISVPAPTLTAVILTPAAVSLTPGATAQFTVAGTWSDGSITTPAVTYAASGGTITAGGLYTAGGTAGTFRVVATQQGGTKADTSTVTISPPAAVLLQLVLSPASLTLAPGASQQFTVAGAWSDGSTTVPAVTYAATGGTITTGGLYTAGATSGTFWVIATQQGGTKADTSTVTITAPAVTLLQLVLSPASLTLAPGATQQFMVTGAWSDGSTTAPAVTYSATGGTITAGGLYHRGRHARGVPGHRDAPGRDQGGYVGGDRLGSAADAHPAGAQSRLGHTGSGCNAAVHGGRYVERRLDHGAGRDLLGHRRDDHGGRAVHRGRHARRVPGHRHPPGRDQGGHLGGECDNPPTPSSTCLRTVSVTTVSGLTSALSQALPGDCILLAAGTYGVTAGTAHTSVGLNITRSGTVAAPIIVQGLGSSTIIDLNQRLMYVDASHIQLRRLRLTDFPGVGLWLRGVTGVVIDSVEVDHTLQEAVALHYGSHHNIIKNSLFHDTGILAPSTARGSTSADRMQDGVTLDVGATDNQVLNNHFGPNVRADAVDVKEGCGPHPDPRELLRRNRLRVHLRGQRSPRLCCGK